MAMQDDSNAAVYVYSYPTYLALAEATAVDPIVKIGRSERGSFQRVASQQRLTGSLDDRSRAARADASGSAPQRAEPTKSSAARDA
jgi:hypothetical protein